MDSAARDGVRGRQVIEAWLDRLLDAVGPVRNGAIATYIPELGLADPEDFAIAIATVDGQVYSVGATQRAFTIQSVSKPFMYAEALRQHGRAAVLRKVGVEPTGERFNSIVLDDENRRPFNPMVNAGAIAVAEMLTGADRTDRAERMLDLFSRFAGRQLEVDAAVFGSELATGHRNRAIAWMMLNGGMLDSLPDDVLDLYFRQCSVLVTTADLAVMGATLAGHGRNPLTGEQVVGADNVRDTLSVMSNCGMYDYAGQWTFDVGLPAKSGVSGGIVAVVPGQAALAVYSPRLDAVGNSVRGLEVCRRFAADFALHAYSQKIDPGAGIRREYSGRAMASQHVRSARARRALAQAPAELRVLELQGPLYFGAAERAARRAVALAADLDTLVLDVRHVDSVDPAAVELICRTAQAVAAAGCRVVASGFVGKDCVAGLAGSLAALSVPPEFMPDVDRALEAFEDRQLAAAGLDDRVARLAIGSLDIFAGLPPSDLRRIELIAASFSFTAGEAILRTGDAAHAFFVVASGTVSIFLRSAEGPPRRVASIGAGQAFGDMALLDGGRRSADVIADGPVLAYAFSVEALRELAVESPALLTTILGNMVRTLSDRLRNANSAIQALA